MEKEFIPYNQALALKELGFNEPCFNYYGKNNKLPKQLDDMFGYRKHSISKEFVIAPTFSQAFRWFREKYNLHCNVGPWGYCIFDDNGTEKTGFENYEQSQLECIEELIKIVK